MSFFHSFRRCWLVLGVASVISPAFAAPFLTIAHRGGSLYAPENTIASFRLALGATDLMETDTHLTSDGQIIIMHDSTVDRTTDGTGAISSMTLSQIKALDAGSWFSPAFTGERVPTMEEMITNTLPGAIPFIERKAGAASVYVAEFQRLGVVTNVIFQAFDWNFLAQVHALEPKLKLCGLGSGTMTLTNLISITNAGATMVSWAGANVSTNEVVLAHNLGMQIFVWTIDSPSDIQRFKDMGVDGVVSNNPWAVRGVPPPISTATNQATFLADRLIAYWKMDDGLTNSLATTVTDSLGTSSATLVRNDGQSHWVSGSDARLGGSLHLAGTNAFVNLPSNSVLNINTNALTLSVWVKLESLPAQLTTSYGAILDSTSDCYVLYLDKNNNELRFKVTDTSGNAARPGIGPWFLQTNQWLHIAATYNGAAAGGPGNAAIYLNGVLMDTHLGNDSTPGAGLTGNVKIGQVAAMGREGPTGGNGFTGMVDDFALWKRALALSEIQTIYTNGLAGLSLGDLLRQPTDTIEFVSVRKTTGPDALEITFHNLGPWQTFRLLRSAQLNGPFQIVPDLAPVSLGSDQYRFTYPLGADSVEYFRVEGQ